MAFGYQPVFTDQEIGFRCADAAAATGATFRQYLAALSAINFQAGAAGRNTVLQALSNFLFADPNVLARARALP